MHNNLSLGPNKFYLISYFSEDGNRETTVNLGPLDAVCADVYISALRDKGLQEFILSGDYSQVKEMINIEKRTLEAYSL